MGDPREAKRIGATPLPPRIPSARFPTFELYAAVHGEAFSRGSRELSLRETHLARQIFGDSLSYQSIRIAVGYVVNAPTTLGNTIRISPWHASHHLPDEILVHELTHVWQFQTGGTSYISRSLCQQVAAIIKDGDRNAAYDVIGEFLETADSVYRLTVEQQAVFVQFWFRNRQLEFPSVQKTGGGPRLTHIRDNPTCQRMLEEIRTA